ncbi:MAG: peptidoglycan-binding protein, partial [Nitrososphaeraceae archaeon]
QPTTEGEQQQPTTEGEQQQPTTEGEQQQPSSPPAEKATDLEDLTTPTQKQPATTPTQKQPATTPTQKQPATTPTQKQPATTPDQKQPAATPDQKQPATTPTQKQPATTPTQKQPAATDLEQLIAPDQKQPATTKVNAVRENEVCKITKLDLKSGGIGDDIVILQKNLKELGYYPYAVDQTLKKFGPKTEMSVRLFQISNKLPVTGIVDKVTQEKICTASTDKNKNRQLILTNFIKNPNVSTLDLLKDGQAFKQFKWNAADYLGNPPGPNEKETLKLVNQLNNIILEDRVNRQANAILIDSEYQKDKAGYNEYFKKHLKPIPDYPKKLLNKYALDSFVKMRQAAKGEGIDIVPLSTYRDPVADAKRAEEANNPNAIAKGISPHGLGVSIDIKMSDGNKNYKETTTNPFSNIMDMRSSSVYKWLVIFGNDFNFHPFNQEPWHWEYNYKNFKPVYFSEFKK